MYGVPKTHLSLEEYWQTLQISECQAYGIRNVPNAQTSGCPDYWQQRGRYWLAFSIAKTEKIVSRTRWLGFPVRREYIATRQMNYDHPLYLGKYLRGVGVETNTLIDQVSISHTSDPVTFTVTVDFTDPDELVLKYPSVYYGSVCDADEIRPSCVLISGTTATVEVPRCRLLKPEFFIDYDKVTERPDYETDANFLSEVDVYRNYLDSTTGANIVWWGYKDCPTAPCGDTQQGCCAYVQDQRNGILTLYPATYSNGAWTKVSYTKCRTPDGVLINFMRGFYDRYEEMDEDLIRAIIAVAHNNMPQDYCTCSVQNRYFEEDTKPLEPAVRLGLGPSTWGIYEAAEIINAFDTRRNSHGGGLL